VPESQLTPEMMQGGVLPARSATAPDSMQNVMASVNIPGVEELGVGGYSRSPQTLEQQLKDFAARKQIEAYYTPYTQTAGRGSVSQRVSGGQVISRLEGDPISEPLVAITDRDASGKETTRYVTREEAQTQTGNRERLPQRASAASIGSDEDLQAEADAVYIGNRSADLTGLKGGDRLRIESILSRRGFNIQRAVNDERAIRAHYSSINSDGVNQLRIAADTAESALDELERINEVWKSSGRGPLSKAAVKIARIIPAYSQLANDFDQAVSEVQTAIAQVKSGGSSVTNHALEDAVKAINTGSNIGPAITRLRTALKYRAAAIRNLEPITPSSVEQGGQVDFEYDPATGQLVPVAR